ncbi:MAG: methyltransferase domain-containing protein [Acidobacteriaceae bacterium]|nr:methyltransferase domain-containing protein [Acidobacteriaceae bacterium]
MLVRFVRFLACPICMGTLDLQITRTAAVSLSSDDESVLNGVVQSERASELTTEVITGALTCSNCGIYYPIHDGVPRMLTYRTAVARFHAEQNREWIRQHLSSFVLPNLEAPPGEEAVLRNFSREWQGYKWSGQSYWQTTPEHMIRCMRYVLGLDRHGVFHKLVLEVGIGIGGIADSLSQRESCELVGMDLGYAVDQAYRYFGHNPRFHIVQGSLFAPPFRPGTFDFVYSQGVLHHTYSTEAAFKRIANLPKPTNGILCVWIYSHRYEKVTPFRRLLSMAENVCRPVLTHLPGPLQTAALAPTVPLYILYQNVYRRRKMDRDTAAVYGWNEGLHAARDRLIPPFAHRHSYEEVSEWFKSSGYHDLELLQDEELPAGIPDVFPLNVGIRATRHEVCETVTV